MNLAASRMVLLMSAAALVALAVWALRPLPVPALAGDLPTAAAPEPATAPIIQGASLDTRAFSTPLWVAPPAPPTPPPPPPPPPPLKLQLIAIVTEPAPDAPASAAPAPGTAAIRSVLIYDPDADRMLSLKVGDRIPGRTIEKITEASVTLKDGSHTRTLSLNDTPSATGGTR